MSSFHAKYDIYCLSGNLVRVEVRVRINSVSFVIVRRVLIPEERILFTEEEMIFIPSLALNFGFSPEFQNRITKVSLPVYIQACLFVSEQSEQMVQDLYFRLFLGETTDPYLHEIPENSWIRKEFPEYWVEQERYKESYRRSIVNEIISS